MIRDPEFPAWYWRLHGGALQVGVARQWPHTHVEAHVWMDISNDPLPIYQPTRERVAVWHQLYEAREA